MLIDDSLAAFAEATAQRTSTPGGGAVAAYLGALGAALGAMASRFTVGRDDFADREPALKAAIEELDRLRHELVGLVDADAEAFGAVTAAYGLPRGSDDEKAARREAIQAALVGAMEVPLRTCRTAIAALDVLDELRSGVTKHLASDVAVVRLPWIPQARRPEPGQVHRGHHAHHCEPWASPGRRHEARQRHEDRERQRVVAADRRADCQRREAQGEAESGRHALTVAPSERGVA